MLQDLDARGGVRAGGVPSEVKPVERRGFDWRALPARRVALGAAGLVMVALGVTAWVVLPLEGKTYDVQPAAVAVAVPAPGARTTPADAVPAGTEPVTVAEVAPEAGANQTNAGKADAPLAAADAAPPPEVPASPARAVARPVDTSPPAVTRAPLEKAPVAAVSPVPKPAAKAPAPPALAAAADAEAAPAATTTSWAVANERFQAEQARLAKRWRAEESRIAGLPRGERTTPEQGLAEEKAQAAARAKADAAWLASLKRKEAASGGVLADEALAAAPTKAAAGRTQGRVEPSSQNAENAYRRALASLQEGRNAEAISGLQATLRANPKHEAARQTLVSLLIESNRGDEAMLQLQQALNLDARQPALAMLLARLQIERGKNGIDTLLRTLPYATGNGDYHAFLAGALQRQARHAEAVEQYQTALRAAPGNAVWWMGLGIALQADKRNSEALEAFRQARTLGTLPADLQSFVERKLQQLAR